MLLCYVHHVMLLKLIVHGGNDLFNIRMDIKNIKITYCILVVNALHPRVAIELTCRRSKLRLKLKYLSEDRSWARWDVIRND